MLGQNLLDPSHHEHMERTPNCVKVIEILLVKYFPSRAHTHTHTPPNRCFTHWNNQGTNTRRDHNGLIGDFLSAETCSTVGTSNTRRRLEEHKCGPGDHDQVCSPCPEEVRGRLQKLWIGCHHVQTQQPGSAQCDWKINHKIGTKAALGSCWPRLIYAPHDFLSTSLLHRGPASNLSQLLLHNLAKEDIQWKPRRVF